MHIFTWFMIVITAWSTVGRILLVGSERKPVTKGEAVASTIINGAIIVGLTHFYL